MPHYGLLQTTPNRTQQLIFTDRSKTGLMMTLVEDTESQPSIQVAQHKRFITRMQPLRTSLKRSHGTHTFRRCIPVSYAQNRRESLQMYPVFSQHNKPTNAQNMQCVKSEHGPERHLIQEKHATTQGRVLLIFTRSAVRTRSISNTLKAFPST